MSILLTQSDEQLVTTLASMCYSEEKPGFWLKPVGFQLFSFDFSRNEWVNWFKDIQGNLCVWEKHKLKEHIDALTQLKEFEAFTRLDIYVKCDSNFHLSKTLINV